jgi:hypothetical protein
MLVDTRLTLVTGGRKPCLFLTVRTYAAKILPWDKDTGAELGREDITVKFASPSASAGIPYASTYCDLFTEAGELHGQELSLVLKEACAKILARCKAGKCTLEDELNLETRFSLAKLNGLVTQEIDEINYTSGMVSEEEMHHRLDLAGIANRWSKF